MIFSETPLRGAFVIEFEPRNDERGFFARAFCQNEFAEHGLKNVITRGYHALTDDSEVLNLVTEFYTPNAERGVRWNHPAFGITWPIADPILSPKDLVHADFQS